MDLFGAEQTNRQAAGMSVIPKRVANLARQLWQLAWARTRLRPIAQILQREPCLMWSR